jgi:hypothetical protein
VPQAVTAPATHVPLPLQSEAAVAELLLALSTHVAAVHTVLLA